MVMAGISKSMNTLDQKKTGRIVASPPPKRFWKYNEKPPTKTKNTGMTM